MKIGKRLSIAYVFALITLMSLSFATPITLSPFPKETQTATKGYTTLSSLPPGQKNMTFTSDVTTNFTSGITTTIHSGVFMNFTSGITINFIDFMQHGIIENCFMGQLVSGINPTPCSWWEILDPLGQCTGYEFHVDISDPPFFHVDMVVPGPYPVQPGFIVTAQKKIDIIEYCSWFAVQYPFDWLPSPCSWWEITYPLQWQGVVFHVDKVAGNQFHVDEVRGYFPPGYLPPCCVTAEIYIDSIKPCDKLWDPTGAVYPTSWWEVISPISGYEFHVDWAYGNGTFHVDQVIPGNITFPAPVPVVLAERKISAIQPCTNLEWQENNTNAVPQSCDWWEILYPPQLKGYEFHIDSADATQVHVDNVLPGPITINPPIWKIVAERKIKSISTCDWFKIADPPTWQPDLCSYWKIVAPAAWAGVTFHVDSTTGGPNVYWFHVDKVSSVPSPPTPPPWNVTAEPYVVHDVAVLNVSKPFASVRQGWPCPIYVNVTNAGNMQENSIIVDALYGSSHVTTSPLTIPSLDPGVSTILTFWWITTGVLPGIYQISAYAHPVPGETHTADNTFIDGLITILPPDPYYWKGGFGDYAPSGMPDFDEQQDGWVNPNTQTWSYCAPTAVANSLWWLDSEFEPNHIPPPTISDGFRLVSSYAPASWDDHNSSNAQILIMHLALLMDTDGQRTHIPHLGTKINDTEFGLSQYLAWTGVNPPGDVNGDGKVDMADLNRVIAALGTLPGMPKWDMACDVFPACLGWPAISMPDNVVDQNDLDLINANIGRLCMFNETTVLAPQFDFIDQKLEQCEDVVLALGFWQYLGGVWYRENYTDPYPNANGHAVTVAGINLTTNEIAISDPAFDAFENLMIPKGRVPVSHALHPTGVTHNDASLVSHDIYTVAMLPPGCPGGIWGIMNYPPVGGGGLFAVIEAAIVTSPTGLVHDVCVNNVKSAKTIIGQSKPPLWTCAGNITVTVQNQGNFTESFPVTLYANLTVIGTQNVNNLLSGVSKNLTFVWTTTNTTTMGNYTIRAYATPIAGLETNTTNNNYVDGIVHVGLAGNIDYPGGGGGGKLVDMVDLWLIQGKFGALIGDPMPSLPKYVPNYDIDNNGKIDMIDMWITQKNFGQFEP